MRHAETGLLRKKNKRGSIISVQYNPTRTHFARSPPARVHSQSSPRTRSSSDALNRSPLRSSAGARTAATGADVRPGASPHVQEQPVAEPSPAEVAQSELPAKRKHRGLMRAIGGLFKRKCSDADDATAPSDSEASQRRTSRWSRWSHSNRGSMPEAPLEVAAVAEPETAPIQENESAASSPHMEEPPAKKAKQVKPKKEAKIKPPSFNAKQSPTDPSALVASSSSDGSVAEPQRVSFLFFGGSDTDSTFQPELRPSEYDELHENHIRPSLQAKMPLFFSPPLVENMRRSSILPDPKEYEF